LNAEKEQIRLQEARWKGDRREPVPGLRVERRRGSTATTWLELHCGSLRPARLAALAQAWKSIWQKAPAGFFD
jgi:hypothetical protein